MGITTSLDPVPSLAIGTSPIKLIDIVSAYTIYPNHGIRTEPFYIDRILDNKGTTLWRQPNGEGAKSEVLRPAVASLMITMFETVAREGTASSTLRRLGLGDIPCGGKTGTGTDYKDAWFVGFTPYIACGVWVGFDSEETTLGSKAYGTGATGALPIWAAFMKNAVEIMGYPRHKFTYEGNLTTVHLCKDSYKQATPRCPVERTYIEYFIQGTEVAESCTIHGARRRGF
jgi:penicillin-binding protein 1A